MEFINSLTNAHINKKYLSLTSKHNMEQQMVKKNNQWTINKNKPA